MSLPANVQDKNNDPKSGSGCGSGCDRGYFGSIFHAGRTILEGMAITFTYLFRKPVTVEYPDRVPLPIADSLPERYRGFLEVDVDICTACKACERDCPIGCIAIDVGKVDGVRAMTRFDIDVGKCMFCGLCVEACPTEAKAPGDSEPTKCIRFSREFEGVVPDYPALTYRFVRPGDAIVPFKPKKGEANATVRRGEIARAARLRARQFNALAVEWALKNGAAPRPPAPDPRAALLEENAVLARAQELAALVAAAGDDREELVVLLYDKALGQTDCGECGYAGCQAYGQAIIARREKSVSKCRRGGAQAARDISLIASSLAGKSPEDAVPLAIEAAAKTPPVVPIGGVLPLARVGG
ncbi:MAG: 4Fe-4S dicluster domain-containing protein [Pseudomonadota bacterium]